MNSGALTENSFQNWTRFNCFLEELWNFKKRKSIL